MVNLMRMNFQIQTRVSFIEKCLIANIFYIHNAVNDKECVDLTFEFVKHPLKRDLVITRNNFDILNLEIILKYQNRIGN